MDPLLQAVLAETIANAATSLASAGILFAKDRISKTDVKKKLGTVAPEDDADAAVRRGLAEVALGMPETLATAEDRLRVLLLSPEVEAVIRQVYSSSTVDSRRSHLQDIRNEFAGFVRTRAGDVSDESVNVLFQYIVEAVDVALEAKVREGSVGAHDALDARRHAAVQRELESVRTTLDVILGGPRIRIEEVLSFEGDLRRQIAQKHKTIMPPHLDNARRIAIDKLYVMPSLYQAGRRTEGPLQEPVPATQFLSGLHRAVLLGDPGGGKSTFVAKVCSDVCSKSAKRRMIANRDVIPLPIVLRDYGAVKKERPCSVLDFMYEMVRSKYQLETSRGVIEYMLASGRLAVVFDGLDELLDTSYRQEVTQDVELFANAHPAVPILVTSRRVGYDQAPLDDDMFDAYHLAPFSDDQVREYAVKWFRTYTGASAEEQKAKSAAFFEESELVADLRANPLMLALMCNIYRGENYIPRNRPDVYEKCANMLFERWDRGRGISVELAFEARVRQAMEHVAYWMYSQGELATTVTRTELVERVRDFLLGRRFEAAEQAERAASDFVDFLRGRAWVFAEVGTTAEGEKLYQFTHRTFLEYFAARHIFGTRPTPEELMKELLPHIELQEWSVVSELAIQIQDKQIDEAGDRAVQILLSAANKSRVFKRKTNVLAFTTSCFDFLAPTPAIVRATVEAAIDFCGAQLAALQSAQADGERALARWAARNEAAVVVANLVRATAENRDMIRQALLDDLSSRIQSEDAAQRLTGFEVARSLRSLSWMRLGGRGRSLRPAPDLLNYWESVCRNVFEKDREQLMSLAAKDVAVASSLVSAGLMDVSDFSKSHSVSALFNYSQSRVFPSVGFYPAAYRAWNIAVVSRSDGHPQFKNSRAILTSLGARLGKVTPPWASRPEQPMFVFGSWAPRRLRDLLQRCDNSACASFRGDALAGVLFMAATLSEQTQYSHMVTSYRRRSCGQDYVCSLLRARDGSRRDVIGLKGLLKSGGLDEEQSGLLLGWANREVSLVGAPDTDTLYRPRSVRILTF